MINEKKYIEAANKSRNEKGIMTDEFLTDTKKNTMQFIEMIDEVVKGEESIAGVCRNHDVPMHSFRRAIHSLNSVFEKPDERIYKRQFASQGLTPIEKIYFDVIKDNDIKQINLVIPEDAYKTVMWLLTPENTGIAERACEIVKKRYFEERTLEDIGKEYGISREYVRIIIKKTLQKFETPWRYEILTKGISKTLNETTIVTADRTLPELVDVAKGSRTTKEFAAQCGINPNKLYRIISCKHKRPVKKDVIEKIADNASCGITYEMLEKANTYNRVNG